MTRPKFCRGLVDPQKNVVSTEKNRAFRYALHKTIGKTLEILHDILRKGDVFMAETRKRLLLIPK